MGDVEKNHIGKLIKKTLKEKGVKVSWFAEQLHCHRNNIYKIFERSWIDTEMLLKMSLLLDFNFFYLYSNCYESIDISKKEEGGEILASAGNGNVNIYKRLVSTEDLL